MYRFVKRKNPILILSQYDFPDIFRLQKLRLPLRKASPFPKWGEKSNVYSLSPVTTSMRKLERR